MSFFGLLAAIIISGFLVLRTPVAQTNIARIMAGYLSKQLGTEIRIDRIRIGPGQVLIRGLYIEDERDSVLVDSKMIRVGIGPLSIRENVIHIRSVELDSTGFHLHNYSGEEKANLQFLVDYFAGTDTAKSEKEPFNIELRCDNLELTGCSFHLLNEDKIRDVDGIDYADMEFRNIDLDISGFRFYDDTISAAINMLRCKEKSGIILEEFSGLAKVSSTGFRVDNLQIMTNNSILSLDVKFDYHHYIAFTNFLEEVTMHADIKPSRLQMADIGYFAPALKVMENEMKISGKFDGLVEDFKASDFKFSTGRATKFYGDCRMDGLPDIMQTKTTLDINYFFTNKQDIERFALPGDDRYIKLPAQLVTLGDIQLMGSFDGVFNDFDARALLVSDLGPVRTDLEVTFLKKENTVKYQGDLETESFDLGTLLGLDFLGEITMDVELFGSGITADDVELFVTGWVDSLDFYDNNYNTLVIGGELTERKFNGGFFLEDELGSIDFKGLVDFDRPRPAMDFHASIRDANLTGMNISDRADDLLFSADIDVMLDFLSIDDWDGRVFIDSLQYREKGYEYALDTLIVTGEMNPSGDDSIHLSSSIIKASLTGDYKLTGLYPLFMHIYHKYLGDGSVPPEFRDAAAQEIHFSSLLIEPDELSQLFAPFINVSPGSSFELHISDDAENIAVESGAEYITLSGIEFDDWSFDLDTQNDSVMIGMHAETVWFRKPADEDEMKDALAIRNYQLKSEMKKGYFDWKMSWDDELKENLNFGALDGHILVTDTGRIEAGLTSAEAFINGERWYIDSANYFVYDSNLLRFKNFNLFGEGQSIKISGSTTNNPKDTLQFAFQNWRLENFKPAIRSAKTDLTGIIDGTLKVSTLFSDPAVIADLKVTELKFNDDYLGEANITSNWLPQKKAFKMGLDVIQEGNVEKYKTIDVSGLYYPGKADTNFDFRADINNLNLGMAAPFLDGLFSGMQGFATGRLTFTGSPAKPVLAGSVKLMRSEFRIDYLNVKYSIANDIYFDRNVIYLENATVYDPEGNEIAASGKVTHDYFSDFTIELNLKPKNAMAFNTTRYMNDAFYGKAYASGDVNITGPFDDLLMDIDVESERGSAISIPVTYSVDISESDFIVFTNNGEDEESEQDKYKVDVKGLTLDLGIKVDRNTDLELFLPGDMGYIKAKGEGDIQMGIDSRGYFDIEGRYVLSDGLFNFSLEQLVSKRFDIVSGSSIQWNGNIYDNEVAISALYRTKTSLAGLGLSLPQGQESQRVNVNLYIILSENLFNPNIRFSIQFPYLDESLKSNIYALLDTNDYALMNQQAISLLVLNSFSYKGYANSQSPINSYSILANQLSSFLSKISNDFDIGVNYIPGDEITREEFEVALSTQLFNDRLIIDGNIDVPTNQDASQNTSDIVGEVNIEYKLTPDGRFRVKAFNRSNTLNPLEQYSPYTQGVGFFYKKEFNNLKELFTPQKSKKQKKKKKDKDSE